MEGTDPKEKLSGTYWEALKKNWMVWPAVQAVNFKFVPLEHRVLVVNVVSLGEWNLPRGPKRGVGSGGGGGRERGEASKGKLLIGAAGWNCYLSYVNSQGGKQKIEDYLDKEE